MAESSDSVVSNNINTSKQTNIVQSSDSTNENKLQNVMEPIFVDDFQNEVYPKSVINILNFLEQTDRHATRNDVLIGLIYILMLESGFRPNHVKDDTINFDFNFKKHLEHTQKLPTDWKKDGTYKLTFILENFNENECMIVCCSSLDDLLVNCCIKGIQTGYTVYLDTLTYFSSSNVNVHSVRLQNLRNFSYKVKENLCYPAKQAILRNHGRIHQCIDSLPDELILIILDLLNISDFVKFGMAALRYNKIANTPLLWFRRLNRDLGLEYDPSWQMMSSKQVIEYYLSQRRKKKMRCMQPVNVFQLNPMDMLLFSRNARFRPF